MPPNTPTPQPKNTKLLAAEVIVGIVVIVGGYFGYTMFFADQTASTSETNNIQLGNNMARFEKEFAGGKVNFDVAFLDSDFVKSLVDYTQTFSYSARRGRLDPFVPIESTRPIRYDSTGSIRQSE